MTPLQPRAERPREQLQERSARLRDLAASGNGAEPFALIVEMLRIAEGDAKDRLVEADSEWFPTIQGEAQAYRKLLKLLTQPKRLVQGKIDG